MDWNLVVNNNRDRLVRVTAEMFSLLRGRQGAALAMLPRSLFFALLVILRPAEAAVRRLIVIAARGLVVKVCAARAFPFGLRVASDGTVRVPVFGLIDPLQDFSFNEDDAAPLPDFGSFGQHGGATPVQPTINATSLFNRMRALRLALEDLPLQARRLARWRARRDLALKSGGPYRPIRMSPVRPGSPPGFRQRPRHGIDGILGDCHHFALLLLNRHDTS